VERTTAGGGTRESEGPKAGVDPGFWKGRRVLVTGHTGFKGAWLSLWLQSLGAHVSGLSLPELPTHPSLYELAGVEGGMERSFACDIRDAAAVEEAFGAVRPEVVLHLAAQPLVRRSFEQPHATYEINVMGTVNVLDAVRTSEGVRAVVIVTSDKCYENDGRTAAYRETDALGGRDPYSSSKAAAELVTSAYRRSFFAGPESSQVASARAGNVIGGGDWGTDRLVPDIVHAATSGSALRLRNPASTRPWQHVINPLGGYLLLAQALWDTPERAGAWNFGPDEQDARTVEWVVERIARLWTEGVRWEVDRDAHPPEARYLHLDSERARNELGWRPALGLDQALLATVEWYRAWRDGQDLRALTLEQIARYAGRVDGRS
jgi:CDP-glucose 4,6-dehydratase